MNLKMSTGYAIKIIIYIAMKKRKVSSNELEKNLCISRSFIFKVCKKLNQGGLIKNEVGVNGGFYLIVKPNKIKMYDLIKIMEGNIDLSKCFKDNNYCSNYTTENCPIKSFYAELQYIIEKYLNNITIDMLLNNAKNCDFQFIPKNNLKMNINK